MTLGSIKRLLQFVFGTSRTVKLDAIPDTLTGKDADSVDTYEAADLLARANHTGANDADTLDGETKAQLRAGANITGSVPNADDSALLDGETKAQLRAGANITGSVPNADDAALLDGETKAEIRDCANLTGSLAADRLDALVYEYGSGYSGKPCIIHGRRTGVGSSGIVVTFGVTFASNPNIVTTMEVDSSQECYVTNRTTTNCKLYVNGPSTYAVQFIVVGTLA